MIYFVFFIFIIVSKVLL